MHSPTSSHEFQVPLLSGALGQITPSHVAVCCVPYPCPMACMGHGLRVSALWITCGLRQHGMLV